MEVALQQDFIPALTGRHACSREERELLALQVRLGGLGIQNPANVSESAFEASLKLTSPLVQAILTQDPNLQVDLAEVISIKDALRKSNQELRAAQAMTVYDALPNPLQRCVELASEKGASSWLSVLPIKDQGFSLNKGEFRDTLCLRYRWPLTRTPTHCNCGRIFTTDHSMICPKGGFPTIRHNELQDMTANLLAEVCHNVATEPHLQPLSGEIMPLQSAITNDDAHLDVHAKGFWSAAQDAFFDVRVFHPNAPSNSSTSIASAYKKHEDIKKRAYGHRIREVEHGVFTPLVFSTTGGMGREATVFYKRLASMLALKRVQPYSTVMSWLRCRLSFALLRSAVMCVRGSRSSFHHPVRDLDIMLATAEGSTPQL